MVVKGMASDEPVRARPFADVLATVIVNASTPPPSPQLTETVTVPEAVDGMVALKLYVPVAVAVPEPICVEPMDAETAPLGSAPVPLTVIC